MTEFKHGQIWLVNFDPSFGHEYKKVRPALIVESDDYISVGDLLTVIPISSRVAKRKKLDVLIKKDAQNRLMLDSMIKTKQISSFDKRRFIKLIGIVDKSYMEMVKTNLKLFFSM